MRVGKARQAGLAWFPVVVGSALAAIALLALAATTRAQPTSPPSPRHYAVVNGQLQAITPGQVIAVGKRVEAGSGKEGCEFPEPVRVGGGGGAGVSSSRILTQISPDCRMVIKSVSQNEPDARPRQAPLPGSRFVDPVVRPKETSPQGGQTPHGNIGER